MAVNKKVLAYVGAGVAGVILLAVCMTQCSGKNEANDRLRDASAQLDSARVRLVHAGELIDSMVSENRELIIDNGLKRDTIVAQGETIRQLTDSIDVLNDSLDIVNGQLRDCRGGKRTVRRTTTPSKPTQPVRPVKPGRDTIVIVREVPTQPAPQGTNGTVVNVNDNAHNNTVNINNGVVNNYYSAPAADADTVKRAQQACAAASQTIVVVRKKVYTRTK